MSNMIKYSSYWGILIRFSVNRMLQINPMGPDEGVGPDHREQSCEHGGKKSATSG